mmetsp:Transcript_4270/g.10986  ORF Transcript_4270/g.10986 Transcript_4270/m.10986 type:complete len:418 (+) Transcript_4270:325-1578(+)
MRDRNSCALCMTTRKPVHPRKDAGPHSAKGRGSISPSLADIWRVRRRHSCCDLICIAAQFSTCFWYISSLSHSRRSCHFLLISRTCCSQCSWPSRAFFCMSGRSLTCSPDRPASSSARALFLLLPPAAAPPLRLGAGPLRWGASSSLSSSSSSPSTPPSWTREAARAAAARTGRWAGASSSSSRAPAPAPVAAPSASAVPPGAAPSSTLYSAFTVERAAVEDEDSAAGAVCAEALASACRKTASPAVDWLPKWSSGSRAPSKEPEQEAAREAEACPRRSEMVVRQRDEERAIGRKAPLEGKKGSSVARSESSKDASSLSTERPDVSLCIENPREPALGADRASWEPPPAMHSSASADPHISLPLTAFRLVSMKGLAAMYSSTRPTDDVDTSRIMGIMGGAWLSVDPPSDARMEAPST